MAVPKTRVSENVARNCFYLKFILILTYFRRDATPERSSEHLHVYFFQNFSFGYLVLSRFPCPIFHRESSGYEPVDVINVGRIQFPSFMDYNSCAVKLTKFRLHCAYLGVTFNLSFVFSVYACHLTQ